MTNNEMINNEVIAEGVAVEETIETAGFKSGKILGTVVIVGIGVAIGVGLYKKFRKKKAAAADETESV